MPARKLEQRVALLEQRVAHMETVMRNEGPPRDWQSTIGMFAGDEVMERICQAALEYREADRQRARRRATRQPRPKP